MLNGDKAEQKLAKINESIGNDEGLSTFKDLLEVIRAMNRRIQALERETGYSESFIDPNESINTRIKNV
jgi:hypothetical protein